MKQARIDTATTTTTTSRDRLIALVKRRDWDTVIQRCKIASTTEYLSTSTTDFQRTPLALSLTLKAPYNVISALRSHEGYETAMTMRDSFCRYLPIHCAIRCRASVRVVSLLIQSNRKMLEITDRHGMTPLHIACMLGSSTSVVKALVEGNSSVLELKTKNGKTPLIFACQSKTISSSTLKILLDKYQYQSYSDEGASTCTYSCTRQGIQENERNLIYPDPNKRIHGEWSALHMAVLHKASLKIMKMLVHANPNACFLKTATSHQTPLGLYRSVHGDDPEVIKILLGPMINSEGKILGGPVNEHPDEDIPGVVHQFLSFPQALKDVLEILIEKFPNHSKICLEDGRLPLHVAIQEYKEVNQVPREQSIHTRRNFIDKDAWKSILASYPNAIRIPVRDGNNILPFMLAANCSRIDLSYELLRSAPDVIQP